MSPKFSGPVPAARLSRTTTPVSTRGGFGAGLTTSPDTVTHEGGPAHSLDLHSELFTLAITNMVGEDTFYESAEVRDARFADLVAQVTVSDPGFVAKLIPWLRTVANMRSAPIVALAVYAANKGPGARQLIARTLSRPDEPAELLGYWLAHYGRKIPMAVKRGIADAAVRMYSESSLLKYDGQSRGVRFADVIELTHPKPKDARQSHLFRYALDRRHSRPFDSTKAMEDGLPVIYEDLRLLAEHEDARRSVLRAETGIPDNLSRLYRASWTWERLAGWLPGGMDAEAWEAVIPQMGYMALLRNLRNFDNARISEVSINRVIDTLTDPDQVARSRQFPFRFLSAYKAVSSDHWQRALSRALDLSVANIPDLPGTTLVLVDVSGSMQAAVSEKSTVSRWEVGGLFATALAQRSSAGSVDVVIFGTRNKAVHMTRGGSVLRFVEDHFNTNHNLDFGTFLHTAIADHYSGHDRVVVFTDDQAHDGPERHGAYYGRQYDRLFVASRQINEDKIPLIYTFDLGGYGRATQRSGPSAPGRHRLGGFTDATFRWMSLVENYQSGGWDALFDAGPLDAVPEEVTA